jgi:hypothetical protein
MTLSQTIYDAGMDNDIIDDDSILRGHIKHGQLAVAGNNYQVLVFGPMTTVRRAVLDQALALARSGGTVIWVGTLPDATVEGGRDDPQLALLWTALLGNAAPQPGTQKTFASGGIAVWLHDKTTLASVINQHIDRDIQFSGSKIFTHHRRVGDMHLYLLQNTEAHTVEFHARLRADGVPQWWDAFTGKIQPVQYFKREKGTTHIKDRLEGNCAQLLVLRPGPERSSGQAAAPRQVQTKVLSQDWDFSVIATRDNQWGEFHWPPTREPIGPEVRAFRYQEEKDHTGVSQNWHQPDYDDSRWSTERYSIGPYWLYLENVAPEIPVSPQTLGDEQQIRAGASVTLGNTALTWKTIHFSQTIGLARPAPWGGHSGYPDGAVDENFIDLPAGRKALFTHLRSPQAQRLGLRVQLRNTSARLWVNGREQPFEDAIGNLPLQAGSNSVLLAIPDGGKGRLYVQRTPPAVTSMEELARGMAQPDLRHAQWIRDASAGSGYLRKSFDLKSQPTEAPKKSTNRGTSGRDSLYRLPVVHQRQASRGRNRPLGQVDPSEDPQCHPLSAPRQEYDCGLGAAV